MKIIKTKLKSWVRDDELSGSNLEVQNGLPENWDEHALHCVLAAVRATPTKATGYSPLELLLGRKPMFPVDVKLMKVGDKGAICPQEKKNEIWCEVSTLEKLCLTSWMQSGQN